MIDSRKRNRKEPYISEKKETCCEIVTDTYTNWITIYKSFWCKWIMWRVLSCLFIYLLHFNLTSTYRGENMSLVHPLPSTSPPAPNLTNLTLTVIRNLTKPDLDMSKRSIELLQSRILRIHLRLQFDCQHGSQNMGEIQ